MCVREALDPFNLLNRFYTGIRKMTRNDAVPTFEHSNAEKLVGFWIDLESI